MTNEITVDLDKLNKDELKRLRGLVDDAFSQRTNKAKDSINVDDLLLAKFEDQISLADLRAATIRYLLGQGMENADALWYKMPIEKVFKDTIADDVEYALLLEGNLEIKLNAEALCRDSIVINQIFRATGITLPHPKSQCWNLWRMYLTSIATPRHNLGSLETSEIRIQELVKNYIETAAIGDSFESALRFGYIMLNGDQIFVHNKQIQSVLESQLKKVDMEAAAEALKDSLIKSEARKVGKPAKAYRFWIFKREAYNLIGTNVADEGNVPPPSQQVRLSEPEHSTSPSKPDGLVTESGKENEASPISVSYGDGAGQACAPGPQSDSSQSQNLPISTPPNSTSISPDRLEEGGQAAPAQDPTLSEPGQPPKTDTIFVNIEELKNTLVVHGLLLGHDFEFAPEQFRAELRSMACAGIIFEPRPGSWRFVKPENEEVD